MLMMGRLNVLRRREVLLKRPVCVCGQVVVEAAITNPADQNRERNPWELDFMR
jgi:hypothetical protein